MQKLIFSFIFILAFSGCAGVMNPYDSNFQCPGFKNGKCVSVGTAYKESKKDNHYTDLWDEGSGTERAKKGKSGGQVDENLSDASLYQNALYNRLSGLLQQPTSPFVVPPQVMRVLILPYTGKGNELYMDRYVYLFMDSPKWLLKNALPAEGGN